MSLGSSVWTVKGESVYKGELIHTYAKSVEKDGTVSLLSRTVDGLVDLLAEYFPHCIHEDLSEVDESPTVEEYVEVVKFLKESYLGGKEGFCLIKDEFKYAYLSLIEELVLTEEQSNFSVVLSEKYKDEKQYYFKSMLAAMGMFEYLADKKGFIVNHTDCNKSSSGIILHKYDSILELHVTKLDEQSKGVNLVKGDITC